MTLLLIFTLFASLFTGFLAFSFFIKLPNTEIFCIFESDSDGSVMIFLNQRRAPVSLEVPALKLKEERFPSGASDWVTTCLLIPMERVSTIQR